MTANNPVRTRVGESVESVESVESGRTCKSPVWPGWRCRAVMCPGPAVQTGSKKQSVWAGSDWPGHTPRPDSAMQDLQLK